MTSINSLYYGGALSTINQTNYTQNTNKTSKTAFNQSSSDCDCFGPAFNLTIGQNNSVVTGVLAYDSSGQGGMKITDEQKAIIDEIFAKYLGDSDNTPTEETMAQIREELAANGIEMPRPPSQKAEEITDEQKAIIDEIFAKYLGDADEKPSEEAMAKIKEELEANGISLKEPPKGPPPGGAPKAFGSDEEDEETSILEELLSASEEDDEDETTVLLELLKKFEEKQRENVSQTALDFLSSII